MELSMKHCSWLVVFTALCLISHSNGRDILLNDLNSSTPNCSVAPDNASYQLQDSLENISSNVELILQPGCHWLTRFSPVTDISNISIVGSEEEDTVISCQEGVGLAFINITDLTIKYVTILNCSLSGSNVSNEINSSVPEFLLTFSIDPALRFGTVIINALDVTLYGVSVNDTIGIGLMAVNVLGSFTIDSCVFFNNTPVSGPQKSTGGGLLVYYHNTDNNVSYSTHMSVSNSSFLYNINCDIIASYLIYPSFLPSLTTYPTGGGGGLSVILAQSDYDVTLDIDQSLFKNNSATHGGGILLGAFIGVQNSHLSITDSTFERNGFDFTPEHFMDHNLSGQGVMIIVDIIFPPTQQAPYITGNNSISIENCHFRNNIALSGSALLYLSRYAVAIPSVTSYSLRLKDCSFEYNKAYFGGAVYLMEDKYRGTQEGTRVLFQNCKFMHNKLRAIHNGFTSTSVQSSSILDAVALDLSFIEYNSFLNNTGTPLHTTRGIIHMHDTVLIANNTGVYGGAMGLSSSSYLILHNNSATILANNSAFLHGGAIYFTFISTNDAINYFDCFIFLTELNAFAVYDFNISDLNITVRFDSNVAPIATQIYGSTLQTCVWANRFVDQTNITSVYYYLEKVGIFQFNPKIDDKTFGTASYKFNVTTNNYPVMPGQVLDVNVIAYDRFNQEIAELIYSNVDDNQVYGQSKSYIDNSVYWFIHDRETNTPLSVRTIDEPERQQDYPVTLFSVQSTSEYTMNVTVRDCYPGFEFSSSGDDLYKKCICNAAFAVKYPTIICSPETVSFRVPNNLWLGPVNSTTKTLIAHTCLFDYCQLGSKDNVTSLDFDVQCKNGSNRAGLLCGQCKEGYSIQFGSNNCARCSNGYVSMILYFIAAGVIVIALIGKVGITVSRGFLNGLIFYSNVIVPFQSSLLMQQPSTGVFFFLYTFSIINLNIGFPVCFYDGMTTLTRNYLNFAFPIYLWILMFLNAFLTKYKFCLKYILCDDRAGVFASTILLSYVSVLQACTSALSVTRIDDDAPWRWAPDPSIEYFSAAHAPLAIISIINIVIYILPFPILLMFPPLALKTRIGVYLIPVYDAFWAPYRTSFHFWIGLRLLARVPPFILASFVPYPGNVFGLGLYIMILLFIHVLVKPFKGAAQNILDVYLLLNILLLVMVSLFSEAQIEFFDSLSEIPQGIYVGYLLAVYSALLLALFAVFLVVSYHIYIRFKRVRKCWNGILKRIKILLKRKKDEVQQIKESTNASTENADPPELVKYTVLREPLLEYGEASLKACYSKLN
uniref:Right handed beta helix domain-containing protein n=1 Tax=Amphimedon queenslandica TaxID=400682 RepID=A0A1X7UTP4_AMPQE